MKFKRKGFTLIELIVVVIILSLLVGATVAIYGNVRKNILEKSYKNVVTYLESKAVKYAKDKGITTVNVETLIKEGYADPDDQETIYDPRDNTSMNCYVLKSSFNEGDYTAKLTEKLSDGNKCSSYEVTTNFNICIYDEVTGECNQVDNDIWLKDNVVLGVKKLGEANILTEDNYNFVWNDGSGTTSNSHTITTNTTLISQNTYRVEVVAKGENKEIGEAIARVNIDMQAPNVLDVKYSNDWSNDKKEIAVNVSDYSGSGIKGVYVGESECTSALKYDTNVIDGKYVTYKDKGIYHVCVKDNVDNISGYDESIIIDKIDKCELEKPHIIASDGLTQDKWHKNDFTLSFSDSGNSCESKVTYFYGMDKYSIKTVANELMVNESLNGKTIYVVACNEADVCSDINSYKIKYDNTPPSYTSGGSLGAGSISKPTYNDNDGGAGSVLVYTCVSTGNVISNTDSCFSSTETLYNYACETTYKLYSYAIDGAGNRSQVYNHSNALGSYYKACYSPPVNPTPDWNPPSSTPNWNPPSSTPKEPECDADCRMVQRSEKYNDLEKTSNFLEYLKEQIKIDYVTDAIEDRQKEIKEEQDQLHEDNLEDAKISKNCDGACEYDSSSGTYTNTKTGKKVNVPSNGKKTYIN